MRAIIQRVTSASVTVDSSIHGQINEGLLVLVGFEADDTYDDLHWMCSKILSLRIFNDTNGLMNLSIKDVNGKLLIISQFTLHAAIKKGNRPSFIRAARPEIALPLYSYFLEYCKLQYPEHIEQGVFGAHMKISLCNDGPVTLFIDSKNKE